MIAGWKLALMLFFTAVLVVGVLKHSWWIGGAGFFCLWVSAWLLRDREDRS